MFVSSSAITMSHMARPYLSNKLLRKIMIENRL